MQNIKAQIDYPIRKHGKRRMVDGITFEDGILGPNFIHYYIVCCNGVPIACAMPGDDLAFGDTQEEQERYLCLWCYRCPDIDLSDLHGIVIYTEYNGDNY